MPFDLATARDVDDDAAAPPATAQTPPVKRPRFDLATARDVEDVPLATVLDPAEVDPASGKTRAQMQAELADYNATTESQGMRTAKLQGTEVLRGALSGATDLAKGALGLPAMLADLPVNAYNAVTDSDVEGLGAQAMRGLSPEVLAPRSLGEEIVGTGTRGLGGLLTGMGAGQSLATSAVPATANLGRVLTANPVSQAASIPTSVGAAEVAREAGAGPVGETIASLAGALVPGALSTVSSATARGGIRGGEAGRQRVERNIETFRRAGTTPSVGQATQLRRNQGAENLLSRTPGGAGPVVTKATTQEGELGAGVEARAAQLMRRANTETSAEQTGRAIERGVAGPGGFVERFRARQEVLYNRLDQFIPPATPVNVTNTQAALAALTRVTPGAAASTARLVNPRITAFAADVAADAGTGGAMPYSAIRELRSRIGREISDQGLVSDVPKAQWQQLYAALSRDLEGAATAAGPQARNAWSRANTYTRTGMQRVEVLDSVVQRAGGPEAIYRAALGNTKEGATTLRNVMQSLDDDGRRMISATVLRRLGVAKPGQQDALGERFSTETFLTNWNGLSREAKRTLFDRHGPQFRTDMNHIASVTENLRTGSKVFANPSGTSQSTVLAGGLTAFVMAAMNGQWKTAALVPTAAGGANLSARLMTNQRFVRWLARSTQFPVGALPAQVNALAETARKTGDVDLARAAALLEPAPQGPNGEPDEGDGRRHEEQAPQREQ